MNIGLLSLIALVLAIAIGFVKKSNVGILCIGLAMLLGLVYGINPKKILSGFNSSLCIQMMGIMYFFSIINGNGTLSLLASRTVGLVGKRSYLIPAVIFIIGYLLCSAGPGAIPTLTIVPVLAVPIAISAGLNPIMVALIGQMGVQAGRMSPLTPDGAVVGSLMAEQGIAGSTVTIGLCMLVTDVLLAIVVYIYYRGWKTEKPMERGQEKLTFGRSQVYSVIGLLVLVIGVLFFSWNVGLGGFLVGSILITAGAGNEKKSVRDISWNVILMVLGVGMLMNIVSLSGGIDILISVLEKVMGERTASSIMSVAAAVMSFFSSGLGVVFPTLIPTAGGLSSGFGVNALEMVAVIVVGGTITGLSPISSAGALVMAAVSQEEGGDEKYPQHKMFVELFLAAILAMLITLILAFIGVYGWIC
ncbi:MAG: hypothetical protein LUE94_08415 [Clostridiales bacterium]|nr:hypothetical protein [Clostridiales bacterium]